MKTSWNLFIFLVTSYIRHSVSGDDNYEGGLNPTPTRKQLPTYLQVLFNGHIMSEFIYEIINFLKYHQNNLIDFCSGRFFRQGTCNLL